MRIKTKNLVELLGFSVLEEDIKFFHISEMPVFFFNMLHKSICEENVRVCKLAYIPKHIGWLFFIDKTRSIDNFLNQSLWVFGIAHV